ncbi:MAG: hypothetical protein NTW87_05585 [Planctomycetota bacterium]|nr:hypothetical protein [Planctomycetota bacterium]
MSKYRNRGQWVLFLGLTVGLATTALTHAGQPKDKPLDLEAEAKQAAQEEVKDLADHAQGIRHQKVFGGTFLLPSDSSQKLSPDVVGSFVTGPADSKPGRAFLVKVENGKKEVVDALNRFDGKPVRVFGKLRVIGPDGEAKYLVVINLVESAPTPPAVERRKFGGL